MNIVRFFTMAGVLSCGLVAAVPSLALDPPLLPGNAAGGGQCTAFSPDSKLLVTPTTSGSLGELTVYDVQNRSVIRSLPLPGGGGRAQQCTATCFSADGRWLAAAGSFRDLLLWDTENWDRKVIEIPDGARMSILAIALSQDGNRLAASCSGRDDQIVFVLDREGKLIVQFALPGVCRSLRFMDDDKSLVCAVQKPIQKRKEIYALCVQKWSLAGPRKMSERENLVLWDMPRLRALAQDGSGVGVSECVLSPDASAMAASAWRDISTVSLASGRGGNLGQHELNVTSLAISADNHVLASGGHWSGGIWLWDLAGGRRQRKLMFTPQPPDGARRIDPTWERGTCRTVALSPDGEYAAATTYGGKDNSVFLWELK